MTHGSWRYSWTATVYGSQKVGSTPEGTPIIDEDAHKTYTGEIYGTTKMKRDLEPTVRQIAEVKAKSDGFTQIDKIGNIVIQELPDNRIR